ncbi:MAG: hypothetical protein ACD_82C00164G0003, partial [uncultured bacterium]
IYEQALTLEHVIFAGFTHEPAINLCEALQAIIPAQLTKFFFSDNGSTAIEIALKMSYQYWRNLAGCNNKNIFLSFAGGYHGDTFGAMSVGASSGFHDHFKDFFFKVLAVSYPDTWDDDIDVAIKEQAALAKLEKYLEQYKDTIAAIILEPLVQGASGMRMCRPEFVRKVVELVRQNNILVIFDEVMTGFGRTGTYFACNQLDIIPDFLCISKGISGGFLPLALTITTNKIYEAFLGDDFNTAFAHAHSYTANPLACSAAITSLKLLQHPSCQLAIQNINSAHHAGIKLLKANCPHIEKTRILGTIAAFALKLSKEKIFALKTKLLQEGLLLRPLGNTIYLLPPYCISNQDLINAYKILRIELTEFN